MRSILQESLGVTEDCRGSVDARVERGHSPHSPWVSCKHPAVSLLGLWAGHLVVEIRGLWSSCGRKSHEVSSATLVLGIREEREALSSHPGATWVVVYLTPAIFLVSEWEVLGCVWPENQHVSAGDRQAHLGQRACQESRLGRK